MIAKIYPDGHPDLQGKKDPTHPVRYFDIRKLTPRESLRLMGVPEKWIDKFFATTIKKYLKRTEIERELEMFGLEDSCTDNDAMKAFNDETADLIERKQALVDYLDNHETFDEEEDNRAIANLYPIAAQEEQLEYITIDAIEEERDALAAQIDNLTMAKDAILAAPRISFEGPVQILSNSSLYKLAGNSIVCDVLMYIYETLITGKYQMVSGEVTDLFAAPTFKLNVDGKIKVVTLCSGYDSQCIAFEMLKERYPEYDYELIAWSEFDPESSRPLNQQPAVVAHNLLFPQWKDRNRGDMTKADWSDLADAGIDILTYSTPCQSISQAGKREGIKRDSGTRSAVLWSTEEAVKVMRPKVLLQENVRALINKVNIEDFREWCGVLEKQGYVNFLAPSFPKPWGKDKRDKKTIPGILNAKDYGVPQNRERVYMVSVRKDILGDSQYEFPRPFALDKCIADVLEEEVNDKFFIRPDAVIKFLKKNDGSETTDKIYYVATDHKLTDKEIANVRASGGV